MKINAGRSAIIASAALFCLALPGHGQTVVSVDFTGGYSTTFDNTNGDFGAGIYTATINGGKSPGIICDDFKDEVTSGEKWNATAFEASSLASIDPVTKQPYVDNTMFGKTIGLTGYAEVATLVSMMFGNNTSYGGVKGISQSEIASAIWDITTPGGISGLDKNAMALVNAVESAFSGKEATSLATKYLATLTNLWILTPDQLGNGEPQEMWTEGLSMPEGGSALMFLLLAGGTCFGAMFLKYRGRLGNL